MAGTEVVLENVTKKFGDLVAVDSFSAEIKRGEYFFLLGPSGCGKTTLLRMIGGHTVPTEGEIYIRNENMRGLPPNERNTAIVWQHFALFPHKTVLGNVAFGLKMKGIDRKKRESEAMDLLEMVGLVKYRDSKPHELSGGQQQRVGFARALAIKPAVLLLDEPLGDLDKLLRLEMRTELKNLQRETGLTFIHVTHDQEEGLSMADRLVVMHQGRIEQLAPPDEIYTKPNNLFVATFMGDNNIFQGQIDAIEGNRVTIKTTVGDFIVATEQTEEKDLSKGDEVSFSVRSDLTKVLKDGEVINKAGGEVTFVEYLGGQVHLYVSLSENGETYKVGIPPEDYAQRSYQIGDHVSITWKEEDGILFTK